MKLFGIPFRIELSFFFTAVLFGALPTFDAIRVLIWTAVVLFSITLHELGHAFAARRFGLAPSITLHAFGGVTTFDTSSRPLSFGGDLAITLAGPLLGLLFGALVFGIGEVADVPARGTWLFVAYRDLLFVNVAWSLLNLLPMLPLDGGLVMQTLVRRATSRAAVPEVVTIVVAAGIVALALHEQYFYGAFLAAWFAVLAAQRIREVSRTNRDAPLWPELQRVHDALAMGGTSDAATRAEKILDAARSPWCRAQAADLLARARHELGDAAGALRALDRMPPEHPVDPALLASLLLETGLPERAVHAATAAFERSPAAYTAGLLVHALLAAGQHEEAANVLRDEGAEHFPLELHHEVVAAAFFAGAFALAADLGSFTFARFCDATSAYNTACALARLGERQKALAFLERAVDAGLDGSHEIEIDPDLDGLRQEAGFAPLVERVRLLREPRGVPADDHHELPAPSPQRRLR